MKTSIVSIEETLKAYNCEVVGTVKLYTDSNYGADADGNRGVSATFVDDYDLKAYDLDGNEITLTDEMVELAIEQNTERNF